MLNKKVEAALNSQINAELYSAYIYLAMAADLEDKNLPGAANWMKVQYQEELFHAQKIFDYVNERQGRVVLEAIEKPPAKWKSIIDCFEAAYKHELYISGRINDLVEISRKEKDNATYNMLQWFVAEQVEEESSVDEIVQKLKLVGDHGHGIFMVDRELATRVFTPPPAEGEA